MDALIGCPKFVKPALSIKTDRLNHQGLALPRTSGGSQPGGLGIFGKRPPIRVNLARRVVVFKQHHDLVRRLDQLERRDQHREGYAAGQTKFSIGLLMPARCSSRRKTCGHLPASNFFSNAAAI